MENKINSKQLKEFKKKLETDTSKILDEEEKGTHKVSTPNQKRETAIKKVSGKEIPEQELEYMKPTPYWKLEKPLKLEYSNMVIHFYEEYGALQVKIMGFDEKTGQEYPEQSISLRKHILFDQPRMLFFLADTLKKWRKEYDEYEKE